MSVNFIYPALGNVKNYHQYCYYKISWKLYPILLQEMSRKCANFMNTGNVQKHGISIHLLWISEYLKCSFCSCVNVIEITHSIYMAPYTMNLRTFKQGKLMTLMDTFFEQLLDITIPCSPIQMQISV